MGLDLVRKGGYAFHCDGSTAYPIIANIFEPNELCDLNEIGLRSETTLGINLRKNSPFFEIFRIKLINLHISLFDKETKHILILIRYCRIREVGILSKHHRNWVPSKPPCNSNSYIFSVGLDYTVPIFLFLAISMMVSLFILICEITYFHFVKRKGRKNIKIRKIVGWK